MNNRPCNEKEGKGQLLYFTAILLVVVKFDQSEIAATNGGC